MKNRHLLLIALLACTGGASAQYVVRPDEIHDATFVYELPGDGLAETNLKRAEAWNSIFKSCGNRIAAGAEDDVFFVANEVGNQSEFEMVMEFDFSATGYRVQSVFARHHAQKFTYTDAQPYYQRFYSADGETAVLIDQSRDWNSFPNAGDDAATGFLKVLKIGEDEADPLVLKKPAAVFSYRIAVQIQDYSTGAPAKIQAFQMDLIRVAANAKQPDRREPARFVFKLVPNKKR